MERAELSPKAEAKQSGISSDEGKQSARPTLSDAARSGVSPMPPFHKTMQEVKFEAEQRYPHHHPADTGTIQEHLHPG